MDNKVLFSSKKQDWETPPYLFKWLNEQYNFTLDAASSASNHLCDRFYTKYDDALCKDWEGSVWLNPPYGRNIGKWVKKSYQESREHGTKIVMLIPARTDTKYFHEFCIKAHTIVFLEGRIRFHYKKIIGDHSATFPSMIVIFDCNNIFCEPVVKYVSLKDIRDKMENDKLINELDRRLCHEAQ